MIFMGSWDQCKHIIICFAICIRKKYIVLVQIKKKRNVTIVKGCRIIKQNVLLI